VVSGLIVGLLLILPPLASKSVWARASWTLFGIDLGHWVVVAVVAGYVQGLFA
jgi:hypothetical protein